MILEPDELAEMRADVIAIMEETAADRCQISRGTTEVRSEISPDQFDTLPVVKESDMPCTYRVSNSTDRFLAGKPQDMNFFTVIVPAGIDVKEDDSLVIAAKGDDAAMNLRVDTVLRKSNAVQWKLICSEA